MENSTILDQVNESIEKNAIDVILFDVFDTLVTRKVHPEYVKKIFSKKLKEFYTLNISSDALYKIRFDLEAKICKKNQKSGYDLEFNFLELTQELYRELENKNILDKTIKQVDFEECCEVLELETEFLIQEIDQNVIHLAREAKLNNIKVYCLSDFYLTKEMLNKLFVSHGIVDIFDGIFVSSEYLLTKRSGRLYDIVLSTHFSNQKVAMIGDNEHSDFNMAKEKGLNAFLLNRKSQYQFYDEHQKATTGKAHLDRLVASIISRNIQNEKSDNIYFQEFAYTLYYFIYLLAQRLKSQKIKHVFFLSREGEFLKNIFDQFLKIDQFKDIQTHYFLVSRKSTFIASLDSLENETFKTLFRQYRKISIESFLKSLNLNFEEINIIINSFKFDIKVIEKDLPSSKSFKALLGLENFKMIYEKKRIEQKANLIEYIHSFGADVENHGLCIVDAGWKGTMQDHLFELFKGKVDITGFYIGLVTNMAENVNSKKYGLVFDYKKPDRYDKVFLENISLFEVMLGASHGSADSYVKENEKVRVVTYQEGEEKEIFDNVISPIQNALSNIILDLIHELKFSHKSLLDMKKEVAKVHARIIYSPTKEEVHFFRKLYHYENFGLFQFSEFNQHQSNSFLKNTKNIMKFVKNPKGFLELSFWKAAALDDIGLLFVYNIYAKYKKLKIFKGLK